jgi:hypothetical protein
VKPAIVAAKLARHPNVSIVASNHKHGCEPICCSFSAAASDINLATISMYFGLSSAKFFVFVSKVAVIHASDVGLPLVPIIVVVVHDVALHQLEYNEFARK